MLKLSTSSHKFDTVIVMLLFALFAVTSFVLIIIGIKQYNVTADTMSNNYQIRTATSFLQEKIRQNDAGDSINISEIEGIKALAIDSVIEDTKYTTFIYCYDGYLRELLVTEDSVFSKESGQSIIELKSFDIKKSNKNLYQAKLVDKNNTSSTVYLTTKSTH